MDERWEQVMSSLDLVFAKVAEVDGNQRKSDTKVDMTTKVMEQMLKDQQSIAKQLEVTWQMVDRLAAAPKEKQHQEPDSPTSSESSFENLVPRVKMRGSTAHKASTHHQRRDDSDRFKLRNLVPKMAFPKFEGDNPCIWKDKCQDYFKLFDLPESL